MNQNNSVKNLNLGGVGKREKNNRRMSDGLLSAMLRVANQS